MGLGTIEAIGVMRMIIELCIEFRNEIYVYFVDFEKDFDRCKSTTRRSIFYLACNGYAPPPCSCTHKRRQFDTLELPRKG